MTTTTNEVNIYNQQIDNDMEAVMKQRVEKSTRESYKLSNITFILWMFDQHKKHPILLQHIIYYMM